MRNIAIAVLMLTGIMVAGVCFAGEPATEPQPPVSVTPNNEGTPPEATPQQPSNWDKFKKGVKQAGSAVASGTENVVDKTSDAVVHGAKKTGEFFSDGYHSTKEYIHEKTE